MVLGLCPAALAEEAGESLEDAAEAASDWLGEQTQSLQTLGSETTVADWKFEEQYTDGEIADATLVIQDQSGNGNDLEMQLYEDSQPTTEAGAADWEDYLYFSDDSMTGDTGSLVFDGDNGTVSSKTGVDLITVDDAPINGEAFRDGYTLEFLYYFPEDWTAADSWMSLMARQGEDGGNPEGEQGTMYTSISNCKEIQFITGNADGSHEMSSAAWSVTMDEGGVWYHIAVVSDGYEISTYINGCEAFRDYISDDMAGMYADPDDGRFRIGSSWWKEGTQTLDKFLQGSLQEVRISNTPLEQEDWLIPDPTEYAGEFGSNKSYRLKNEDNYNIVLLPDTQNCVEFCGEDGGVMDTAIKELIDTADDLNVIGVVGLGDIVDDNNATQYATAKRIFYQLPKAGIKTLLQPGNHDGWNWSDSYSQTFGAGSEWAEKLTNGYLTTYDWSGCMFVQGGDRVYMIMSIANEGGRTSWNGNNRELNWFKSMLEKYKNIPTIVTTHDVQNCSDTEPSAIKLSKQGQKLWDLVKGYDQVFMMVGGHSHGSGVEILENDNGKDVISILTDFQFGYNGGNGWFRYLEFDEADNKIYYSVYSPYAASLDEDEKSFFDVNFLTGAGNEGEIDWNFEERFAGLDKAPQAETATEGKWMSGEYHTHTGQSKDATESFMSLENVLGAAFRNEDILNGNANGATKTDNITSGDGFDYLMLADHLRKSYNGVDENGSRQYNVPFYVAAQTQQRELEKLQLQGLYTDRILYSGFEWDMPGLDHAAVGLIDSDSDAVPTQGIHQFEWLYGSQRDGDDTNLYDGDTVDEQAMWGDRKNPSGSNGSVDTAVEAVEWVKETYPDSFILPNHPSRHNNSSGVVTIEALRRLNDAAPNVVFGFEGMPGNQMDPSCELPAEDIRAGADEMISVTGGVWDALLAEGRRFYNFANSDFHFKISTNEQYSSGYWASEFSENCTWVEPGEDGRFTFSDVVEGMRSGKSYAVKGDLISDLTFTVSQNGKEATMGEDLNVASGTPVTITIRFRVPETNNYQSLYKTNTGIDVDNQPEVDHVDLIMGHVTGTVDSADYNSTANTDAKIVKTFTKTDLAAAKGADGFYTLTYTTEADSDLYFRVRGLSSSEVDAGGDPVTHERTVTDEKPARFDYINDYNYSHLSFYANPVWVNTDSAEEPQTGYEVTFAADGHTTVDVYNTQDYSAADATNVSTAYARDSKTGEIDISGEGQVNFKVNVDEGYEIVSVAADQNYKNLKGSKDTGVEGIYRLTKVTGPVTVTITTQPTGSDEPEEPTYTPVVTGDTRVNGYYDASGSLKLELAGRYNSGAMNADGGSLEIVQYNPVNGYAYAVSGVKGKLIAVDLNGKLDGDKVVSLSGTEYDVKSLVNGFAYGDMTSVAIAPGGGKLAVAIQAEGYADEGVVALFSCNVDGSLTLLSTATVGVQPDMVTFANENTILSADEGEPREGKNGTDPKGSVSVITIGENNSLTAIPVCFDSFDARRDELTAAGVLVQKDTQPSTDFEPEYIAVSGNTAYVSLQEANAIAVLDIASKTFTGVYPLGFQDYGTTKVDLQKNDKIELNNYENVYGIRMPDGISVNTIGGKTYLLTANEGDSRADWAGLDNELEGKTSPTGNVTLDSKVVWFNANMWDGLDENKAYVFGGRSFSIYEVTNTGLSLAYDSGSDFEQITAEKLPDYFNCSNDKMSMDNRSGKKGPEPETVITGGVNGKTYAFIALERIGGVMVYDITDPANAKFVNYINSREFDAAIQGDVSPEGLCFVPAANSKTGNALLLTACEVSGTLAVYEMTGRQSSNQSGGSSSSGSSASSSNTYPVAVDNIRNGTVTVTPKNAGKGDTVIITVKPDNGYELEKLTVTGKNGDALKITEKNGTYTFVMPAGKVTVKAAFAERAVENPFVDVSGDAYYAGAVKWAAANGITGGTTAITFSPNASCTRAQAVTFLWRAAGSPAPKSSVNPFVDLQPGAYYYDAVLWAVENGITVGTTAATFDPNATCSRAQIVTFLWRAQASPAADTANPFADVANEAYYGNAVLWAVENGITAGTTSTTFSPGNNCTRAQIVTFLWRCMEK